MQVGRNYFCRNKGLVTDAYTRKNNTFAGETMQAVLDSIEDGELFKEELTHSQCAVAHDVGRTVSAQK